MNICAQTGRKATVMEKDGTVRLTLKNGTVLGKGDS